MKLYIAGPMTGLPDFNYPAFNEAEGILAAAGYEVLNPVLGEKPPALAEAKPHSWYMRRALRQLLDADGVALLPGWSNSTGADLEQNVAVTLGMDTGYVEYWLQEAGALA